VTEDTISGRFYYTNDTASDWQTKDIPSIKRNDRTDLQSEIYETETTGWLYS